MVVGFYVVISWLCRVLVKCFSLFLLVLELSL